MTCIDRGDIVGSVFLDFRKQFDLVDHSFLVDILYLYKCQGSDLNLISSYLQKQNNRKAMNRNWSNQKEKPALKTI